MCVYVNTPLSTGKACVCVCEHTPEHKEGPCMCVSTPLRPFHKSLDSCDFFFLRQGLMYLGCLQVYSVVEDDLELLILMPPLPSTRITGVHTRPGFIKLFCFVFLFEQSLWPKLAYSRYTAKGDFELLIYCLCLRNAGIVSVHHSAWGFLLLLLFRYWDGTQGFLLAKQVFCQLSYTLTLLGF